MKAARLHEFGKDFVIEEVPTPEPGPGEVLVRIGGAGACHSDLHIWSGERPHLTPPLTLGHENAGWIAALGDGVTGLDLEAPVVVYGGWGCGQCRLCLSGAEQICDNMRWGGVGKPGGYAEYLLVPHSRHLLGAGSLDPADAAPLTDAALTPYSAVKKALPRLVPGTTAVVIGAGGLGQYGIQFLKLLSPARVIVVDTSPQKRATAREVGADHVVDPLEPDALDQVRALTGPDGAAAVLDFVGIDSTMALGTEVLGRRGIFLLLGMAGGSAAYTFRAPAEAVWTGSAWGNRNELEEVLALAQAGRLVSNIERRPLEEVNEVFRDLEAGRVQGRAVLVP